jgi:hypothetical protein
MGLDLQTEQLVSDQVRDFVGHGLPEKVFAVFPIQLWVEPKLVFRQVRHASLLSAQLEAHFGTDKGLFEEGFGLLVAVLYAAQEVFRHEGGYRDVGGDYAQAIDAAQP